MKTEYEANDLITNAPRELLLEIHHRLNSWEWHPALGEAPEGWDDMSWKEKLPHVEYWMVRIEAVCSQKEILRYHHIHNLGKTPEQFEDWWDSFVLREILDGVHEQPFAFDLSPMALGFSIGSIVVSLILIITQLC